MSGIRNLADNVSSISSNVQSQIDLKAPLANPTFTGTVTTNKIILPKGSTDPITFDEGSIFYNTTDGVVKFANGISWKKITAITPKLTSISGTIYTGISSTLSLMGDGFLNSNLIVNFVYNGNKYTTSVTPSSVTTASVNVPSSLYNIISNNDSISIYVTNSDVLDSNILLKTAITLPTGGTVTTSGNYRIHSFTSSGTFINLISNLNIDYLIVAGGGGGAGTGTTIGSSAGGGAGGLLSGSTSISSTSYSIVVGAGGSGGGSGSTNGSNGGSSSAFGLTAIGGGTGGYSTHGTGGSGYSGGSGGGGGYGDSGGGSGGSGTSGQGYNGGSGAAGSPYGAGGGGGAGAVGGSGHGGSGGTGVSNSITGTATYYSGGGGGGCEQSSPGSGGNGGGGRGGSISYNGTTPVSGTTNTGGGGGGAGGNSANGGASGGSGIIIIRYTI